MNRVLFIPLTLAVTLSACQFEPAPAPNRSEEPTQSPRACTLVQGSSGNRLECGGVSVDLERSRCTVDSNEDTEATTPVHITCAGDQMFEIAAGRDGLDGADGQDGQEGQDGLDGADGQDGLDAAAIKTVREALHSGDAHCPAGGERVTLLTSEHDVLAVLHLCRNDLPAPHASCVSGQVFDTRSQACVTGARVRWSGQLVRHTQAAGLYTEMPLISDQDLHTLYDVSLGDAQAATACGGELILPFSTLLAEPDVFNATQLAATLLLGGEPRYTASLELLGQRVETSLSGLYLGGMYSTVSERETPTTLDRTWTVHANELAPPHDGTQDVTLTFSVTSSDPAPSTDAPLPYYPSTSTLEAMITRANTMRDEADPFWFPEARVRLSLFDPFGSAGQEPEILCTLEDLEVLD